MTVQRLLHVGAVLLASTAPAMGQALPDGAGRDVVQTICSQCHSLANIRNARLSRDEWQGVVKQMIDEGAPLSDREIPIVVDYLSTAFPREDSAPVTTVNSRDSGFVPVTDAMLKNPDPGDWLRWRRDQAASGYSPLDHVSRQNVQKMRLAWTWALEAGEQEQEPIVYRGVMYVPNPRGVVQALDARTGALLWEYRRKLPPKLGNGTTRNIAVYQDRIFLSTEDGYLVALDARTGAVVWEEMVVDYQNLDYTSGPIAADGKIFAGQSCATVTPSKCALTAHDAATGKLLWRRESIAGPTDPKDDNATWGNVPYEKRMKGSFWMAGSYDPDLKLLYWTTASAQPYPEILKGTGTGELHYTNAILALDPNTGAIKWFHQMLPRDNFDMDHQDNPILADVQVGGRLRKAIFIIGKPGILWAFDRENGAYLWHRQLVSFQNIYESIDSRTGKVTVNEKIIPKAVGVTQMVCPGMRGGKLFQAKAFSPRTNAVYASVSNECTMDKILPLNANGSGSGLDYSKIVHMEGSGEKVGTLAAVSASTGDVLWRYDQRAGMGSVLATAGGLVFAGDLFRYFRAFDAETGRILWETPLSGPVSGYPISYAVEATQYVAVAVAGGGGTQGTRHLSQLYPELKVSPGSNMLMVFAAGE